MSNVLPRARTAAHATGVEYANGDDRPLSGYAAALTAFGAVMTVGRPPRAPPAGAYPTA